jgi:hypothetical protein
MYRKKCFAIHVDAIDIGIKMIVEVILEVGIRDVDSITRANMYR